MSRFKLVCRAENHSSRNIYLRRHGAAGTDMVLRGAPAYPIARELSLMVEYGITPVQAIQTASGNPAKVLDRADEFGTIAPGLAADLLVVEGNAAEEIGAISHCIRSFNKKVPNLVTRVWYFF